LRFKWPGVAPRYRTIARHALSLGLVDFELTNFLYRKVQMSAGNIDTISHLWSASHKDCKCPPPFQDHQEMYDKIDAIAVGDAVPWESFALKYEGPHQDSSTVLPWMKTEYRVYYHDPRLVVKNMLLNPDFKNAIDYTLLESPSLARASTQ
jgi:hypothetical protein